MKVTVLGSGTSTGVPTIGCECAVCQSDNPRNQRLRSSALFQVSGRSILVDTSPDLRQQALKYHVRQIDAVLFTHEHADHVHGIDELRVFNALQQKTIPVFGTTEMMAHLEEKFPYIFPPADMPLNRKLVPQLITHAVNGLFDCLGVSVTMIPCQHGPQGMTFNYRIGPVAWLTDTSGICESSLQLLQNLEVLFLDGLRHAAHPTHFNLNQAIAEAQKISARRTFLIHLTHDYDHDEINRQLPDSIQLAHDGLIIESDY